MNLSVVFADRAGSGSETRIRCVGAAGPLPGDAEHLGKRVRGVGGMFPFRFRRQPGAGPAGIGGGFEIGEVQCGLVGVQRMQALQSEAVPGIAFAQPV